MSSRLMYGLTFVTYALIHSVRTSWSFIKPYMQHPPYSFSTQFLGELDLTILISLAISLKTVGWIGQKIGHKVFLLIGVSFLALFVMVISMIMAYQITEHWAYIFLLCITGISMCTGWPSCLSIVSKYYRPLQNSFLICIWNGCSQFGDLIAVFLGYIIIQWGGTSQGYLIMAIGILLIIMLIINGIFLVAEPPSTQTINQIQSQNHRQTKIQEYNSQVSAQQNSQKEPSKLTQQISYQSQSQSQNKKDPKKPQQSQQVNFLNVWCLPSVPSFVCCYACLKAINAIIMNWLIMYLYSIGLNKLSGIITLAWSISIFVGSLLMGYYNKSTSKIGLMIPLLFTGFVFGYLGVEYQHQGSINYSILLILSGVCFGGPFALIGSKVALILGQHPQIKPKKNALGAIISLMEGFGQLISAFFVLIIPYLGLRRLFYIPTMLCMIASAILFYQHKKGLTFSKKQDIKRRQIELKNINQQI